MLHGSALTGDGAVQTMRLLITAIAKLPLTVPDGSMGANEADR